MGELAGARQSAACRCGSANSRPTCAARGRAPPPRARSSRGTRRWRSHSTRRIGERIVHRYERGSSYSGWGELRRVIALTALHARLVYRPMPDFHRIEDCRRWRASVVTRGWVMTTALLGQDRVRELRDGTGYLQVVLSKKDVPGDGVGGVWPAHSGDSIEVSGTCAPTRARPGGRRADGGGPADRGTQSRLPDHPEGARHRVPVRAPPPLAPQPAPGGDRAGAPRGCPGDPRLLLRAAFRPGGHADPSPARSARRPATCSPRNISTWAPAYSRRRGSSMSRPPLPRSGRCTASDPRFERKIEDRRHLTEFWDGGARGGVERLRGNMTLQEEFRLVYSWRVRSSAGSPTGRARARRKPLEAVRAAVPAHRLYGCRCEAPRPLGSDIEWGRIWGEAERLLQ